jgi:hypothetical protein
MFRRIAVLVAAVCCAIPLACNKPSSTPSGAAGTVPAPQVPTGEEGSLVTAEVYQEHYVTISDNPDVSPIAYHVTVTVKNSGSNPIVYDTVQAAFLPGEGKNPLIMTTHPYDKDRGDKQEAYKKDRKSATIAPGATETFNFTTNGYTFKLLRDAGKAPLEFVVILVKGDDPVIPVVGPYAAPLPALNDLLKYEQSVLDKTPGKALTLKYTRKK